MKMTAEQWLRWATALYGFIVVVVVGAAWWLAYHGNWQSGMAMVTALLVNVAYHHLKRLLREHG